MENNIWKMTMIIGISKECSEKIRSVIYDHFAEIHDIYGLSIIKKFD